MAIPIIAALAAPVAKVVAGGAVPAAGAVAGGGGANALTALFSQDAGVQKILANSGLSGESLADIESMTNDLQIQMGARNVGLEGAAESIKGNTTIQAANTSTREREDRERQAAANGIRAQVEGLLSLEAAPAGRRLFSL